jgi:hypothetical protein
VRFAVAGDLDVPGRVRVDQLLPDRYVQCRSQRGPQVGERSRRLRLALAVDGLGDLREHRAQQRPVEVSESIAAQMRDKDEFDVAGVGQAGGRPEAGAGVQSVS